MTEGTLRPSPTDTEWNGGWIPQCSGDDATKIITVRLRSACAR
jgi:hypothetical protein